MPQTAPKMASKFLSYAIRAIECVNKCLLDDLKSHPASYSISVSSAVRRISLTKWPTDDKMAAIVLHRLLRLSDVNVMKPKSTLSDRSDFLSFIVAGAPFSGVINSPIGAPNGAPSGALSKDEIGTYNGDVQKCAPFGRTTCGAPTGAPYSCAWRTGGQLLIGCGTAGTLLDAYATELNLREHS